MAGGLRDALGGYNEGARFRSFVSLPPDISPSSDGHRNGRPHGHVIVMALETMADPGDGGEVLVTGMLAGLVALLSLFWLNLGITW